MNPFERILPVTSCLTLIFLGALVLNGCATDEPPPVTEQLPTPTHSPTAPLAPTPTNTPAKKPPYPHILGSSSTATSQALQYNTAAATDDLCSMNCTIANHDSYLAPGSASSRSSACDDLALQADKKPYTWCKTYERAVICQMQNIANILQATTKNTYDFFGTFNFSAVDESGMLVHPDSYVQPIKGPAGSPNEAAEAMVAGMVNMFGDLCSSDMNWGSRLNNPLAGSDALWDPYLPPLFVPTTATTTPELEVQSQYSAFYDYATSYPEFFAPTCPPPTPAVQPGLKVEMGGGGGFGCYIGTIPPGAEFVNNPLVQFGAGFGFGMAATDGVDTGYGGGTNLCDANSPLAGCIESPIYWGGGGGVNNASMCADGTVLDADQSGDRTQFNGSFATIKNELTTASDIYVSCGGGGGLGFQSKDSSDPASKLFTQTYGFGGGGWWFFQLCKDTGTPANDCLKEFSEEHVSNLISSYFAKKTGTSPAGAVDFVAAPASPEKPYAFSGQGLVACNSAQAKLANLPSGLGFVYAPYHFPVAPSTADTACTLQDPSANVNPENLYIPGSTSPASLFFKNQTIVADLAVLKNLNASQVLYTLNVNPIYVDYQTGASPTVIDINENVMAELGGNIPRVALAIPLFLTPDDTSVQNQAPIITANKEALDLAVHFVNAYPSVDTLILGAGDQDVIQEFDGTCDPGNTGTITCHAGQDVIQGFDSTCNGFNYMYDNLKDECGAYETSLTFADYEALVQYLAGAVGGSRSITVAINQTEAHWTKETSVSNKPDATKQSLLSYFYKSIKPQYSSGNVVLKPMVTIDPVGMFSDTAGATWSAQDALGQVSKSWIHLQDYMSSALPNDYTPQAFIVQTGWTDFQGTDPTNQNGIADFYETIQGCPQDPDPTKPDQVLCYLSANQNLVFDEVFDQPWKALAPTNPGMAGNQCGKVFPIASQDPANPQGPPLAAQLPVACAQDFYNFDYSQGGQPEPPCLCLTNSADYPASFFGFTGDVVTPAPQGIRVIPPRRVMAFSKDPAIDSFYKTNVQGKDGAFNLGVTYKQFPLSISSLMDPDDPQRYLGTMVPMPASLEVDESLRCVGVSDAQDGAASANTGFYCPQVWFQGYDPNDANTNDTPYDSSFQTKAGMNSDGCPYIRAYLQGSGYDLVTGWRIKTLEAPAPNALHPAIITAADVPIVMIPQQAQQIDHEAKRVTVEYEFCPGGPTDNVYFPFPDGLDAGTYFFEIKPLAGIPSTQAIDFDFHSVVGMLVEKTDRNTGPTNWQKLGKFTMSYPGGGASTNVSSIEFVPPPNDISNPQQAGADEQSFRFTPCVDNCLADFSLPGLNSQDSDDPTHAYVSKMNVRFFQQFSVPDPTDPEAKTITIDHCSLALDITAGKNDGDEGGQAKVLFNLAYPAMAVPQQPKQFLNCWLELASGGFVNGAQFASTLPANGSTPPEGVCVPAGQPGLPIPSDPKYCAKALEEGTYISEPTDKVTCEQVTAATWCDIVETLVPQPPKPSSIIK